MISCSFNTKKSYAVLVTLLFVTVLTLNILGVDSVADTPQSTLKKAAEQRLIGRWVRPDGGYVIEIKEIGKDGILKAAYYNPRPINVARAEFSRKDNELMVYVELRDVNYPGSKYNLKYDPVSDKLTGTYFQAVQGETYDVEFSRSK